MLGPTLKTLLPLQTPKPHFLLQLALAHFWVNPFKTKAHALYKVSLAGQALACNIVAEWPPTFNDAKLMVHFGSWKGCNCFLQSIASYG